VITEPEAPAVAYSISGAKFNDLNGNRARDDGEPGLPGWTIRASGTNNTSAVTGPSGDYMLDNLAPGSYTVSEDAQTVTRQCQQTALIL
jgi:hypothetical protein